MSIKAFAEKYRLRTRPDDCEEIYIPARRGQIFDHCDDWLGVKLINENGARTTARIWNEARRAMQLAGLTITQDGDEEGTGLFNPHDTRQVEVAFKVVKPYRRKKYGPEALERLRQNLERANIAREARSREALQGQILNCS